MKIFYQTSATATDGRNGKATLDDNSFEVQMIAPGSKEQGVNPEQLFALGYASCFDSAVAHVAQKKNIPVTSSRTNVEVGIGQDLVSGSFGLEVSITLYTKGLTQEQAEELLNLAHNTCPYSNATRNNIKHQLKAIVE